MQIRIAIQWVFAAVALLGLGYSYAQGADSAAVEAVMKKQFDRPDAPLKVAPVTIVNDLAIAGWLQGDRGGRALLLKGHGAWVITVCAGDGLKDIKVLESTGMSYSTAKQLAIEVVRSESKLSEETRQRFASFEGFMKIDASSAHGHGAHHDEPHSKPVKGSTHP
ncbi:MAG: copper uptake system-associated protein [Rhodoferax sp.]|nr:MAG: copper uptake system-associated protein [Rhodoferax sp.]